MIVPFFNYKALYLKNKKSYDRVFSKICSNGSFILQNELKIFEKQISRYVKSKYVFGVANGTDAIWIGLIAAGIKKGDEIIIPSHTYIATAAAVNFLEAIPVLCNCGEDGMMDVNDIENRITKKTRAIMPVQLNGRCCQMDKIKKICKKYKLMLFEDSAQGLGSKYKGKSAGTFGLFGTISFYPAKLLGCFGDGGVLMTNNKNLAKKIEQLRDHGRDATGKVKSWGYNSRLDNLQAGILTEKLKYFDKNIKHRRKLATLYHKHLANLNELKLPPEPNRGANFDVYQNFEIRAKNRNNLQIFLKKNGIGSLVQWGGYAVHQIKSLKLEYRGLEKTNKFFKECLMLPMHHNLSIKDVEYVCRCIKLFYSKNKNR